jgi:cytochrome c-type biogenesis protein CcmH/NrfG
MSETVQCPDCGFQNPAGSPSCERCHFPLIEGAVPGTVPLPHAAQPTSATKGSGAAAGAPVSATPGSSGADAPVPIPPFRPIRPRRPRPQANVALTLWLGVGAFLALLLVLIAVQANLQRHDPPVEGSSEQQQKSADGFRAALERDSTDTRSRVGLADVLFDTGNWSEAIIHYRAAIRQDSSLVTAIVDLGVCYYNLSVPDEAERLFNLALSREPHQTFALFNMGIVQERRGDNPKALEYFHRALESSPPENMKPALMEAMQRVAGGRQAPPLNTPK